MERLPRKFLRAIDLAAIALCAVFVARAVTNFVATRILGEAPPSGAGPPAVAARMTTIATKRIEEILGRNIFCSTCPRLWPPREVDALGERSDTVRRRTTLPLRLLAVMFAPAPAHPSWSLAIIRDTEAKVAGPFAVGMTVREAKVTGIGETRVDLEIAGRREYLELVDAGPAAPLSPAGAAASTSPAQDRFMSGLVKGVRRIGEHRYEVQRAAVDALLGNANALSSAARVMPELRDGRAFGFRLVRVRPDGPFATLGIRDGDVISAINGLEMSSVQNALDVYTKLKSARHLTVSLERGGRRITQDYDIR